tara:strand:+ start:653 stop:1213 length:561 start_codon:yes stop_codon:yes gene_type:complete
MIPIKNRKNLESLIEEVKKLAYIYLDKYTPSKQQLKTYLLKKMITKPGQKKNTEQLINLIDIIISDLENKKFLSDKFYSESKAKSFLRKGYSLNKIRYTLMKKGIEQKYIKSSISKIKNEEIDPDFFSALKLCKKRRIGAIRDEANRSLFYKKDMGILARSGFNFEMSKKILDLSKEEFLKLSKLI